MDDRTLESFLDLVDTSGKFQHCIQERVRGSRSDLPSQMFDQVEQLFPHHHNSGAFGGFYIQQWTMRRGDQEGSCSMIGRREFEYLLST